MVEQFAVGGTVHGAGTDQADSERWQVPVDMLEQFMLGYKWADQQPFGRALKGLGDVLEKVSIERHVSRPDHARLVRNFATGGTPIGRRRRKSLRMPGPGRMARLLTPASRSMKTGLPSRPRGTNISKRQRPISRPVRQC